MVEMWERCIPYVWRSCKHSINPGHGLVIVMMPFKFCYFRVLFQKRNATRYTDGLSVVLCDPFSCVL